MTPDVLGRPEYRLEGREKVTGQARFAADHPHDGVLHVALVRSPVPHARIVSVDAAAARAMPGVRAVLTGADVRPARLGRRLQDWPLLVWDRVRLVGDRVAAVAAETRSQAEAAARAVAVTYEELPAVFDVDAALASDAPVLHPEAAGYRYLDGVRPAMPHPNIQGRAGHEHGAVDAAFASAEHVFEHEFEIPRTYQGHLEPRATLAWTAGDTVHIVSTNKSPYILRGQLAAALALPEEHLVIEAGYIGGDFGGKGFSVDEYLVAVLARRTGRPVRSVTSYADDLRATNTRHAARIRLRTATDRDGNFLAHDARVVFDGGAYAAGKPAMNLLPGEGLSTLAGYRLPASRVEALTVYTNTVPAGQARAPGQAQNAFAAESHVDLIAHALAVDPLELRLRNAVRPGDRDVLGHPWRQSSVVRVLETLRARPSGPTPRRADRGRGVALGVRPSPAGKLDAVVVVTVRPDGTVQLLTGCPDQGGGAYTMLARVVAQELGITEAGVAVVRGNTDEAPYDLGAGGSRITPVVGGAARDGARELRKRLDGIAPERPVEEQLQAAGRAGVRVEGRFTHAAGLYSTYAYQVEVEVDRETGDLRVSDCVLVADVGAVINPLGLRGQLVGGFVTGVGQALTEDFRIEDGVVVTGNLDTYTMPTMADVPPLDLVLVTDQDGDGPWGAKSAGELTNPAIAPAIANAVQDAVGVRVSSLPVTAEKIHLALRRAS